METHTWKDYKKYGKSNWSKEEDVLVFVCIPISVYSAAEAVLGDSRGHIFILLWEERLCWLYLGNTFPANEVDEFLKLVQNYKWVLENMSNKTR